MRLLPSHLHARLAAFLAVCVVALVARADDGPAAPEPDLRPREVRGLNIQNTLGAQVPGDLRFTQVDGSPVTLNRFFNLPSPIPGVNKPIVLIMVYLRCPILCPMVLEKFTKTLNEIDFTVGSEYDAMVISFDPRDTPEDAARHRADQLLMYRQPTTDSIRDGWTFLTSNDFKFDPERLAEAIGFEYRYIPAAGEFAHGAAVYILTPSGKVSRILTGLNYPPRDVRLALLEASEGKMGTLFDRFTLWCYHYDPKAGSYVLLGLRVMQVGATLVAVLLGGFIFGLLRWERRKARRLAVAGESGVEVSGEGEESQSILAVAPGARNGRGRVAGVGRRSGARVGLSGHAR